MSIFCHNRKIIGWKLKKWKRDSKHTILFNNSELFLENFDAYMLQVSSQKSMANDPFLSTLNHDGDWATNFRRGCTVFCATGENFHLPPHRSTEAYSRNLLLVPWRRQTHTISKFLKQAHWLFQSELTYGNQTSLGIVLPFSPPQSKP